MSASTPATTVVDASSGRLLYRRGLASDANAGTDRARPAPATGIAYRYFPGHKPRGGTADPVNFTRHGWLSPKATVLSGNNAHAYSDVNDDNKPNPNEQVHPRSGHSWNYPLKPFHLKHVSFCGHPYPCTWNPNKPYSWRVNRKQNTTQVFFYVNNWHDHLQARPDRVHRGRRQLPGGQPLRPRQAGRPGRHPDRGRREHPPRAARRRPHRQREHGHATGRAVAADADVPAAPARHVLPERRPVRADRRRRRGRHRLPRVHPRTVEPAGRRRDGELDPGRRRGGRHGRGVERLVRDGLPGLARPAARCEGPTEHRPVPVRRRRHGAGPHRADRLQAARDRAHLQRRRHRPPRRLHLRRLRQRDRYPRGALRRRDLVADAVGPARPGRLEGRRIARHPRDGAVAGEPVLPRRAQRDPDGRHRRVRSQVRERHLAGVRTPRHGLLRRRAQR